MPTTGRNGRIWTGDPSRPAASALATRDGWVIAVGGGAGIAAYTGARTQVIDAPGRRVIPG